MKSHRQNTLPSYMQSGLYEVMGTLFVSKDNSLRHERHGGKRLMTKFSFWDGLTL